MDSFIKSLVRGRLGAALLAAVVAFASAFGIDSELSSILTAIGAGTASVLALLSKIRELRQK